MCDNVIKERKASGHGGYICRGLIGQGAFSKVYCVQSKADGRVYACKLSGNIKLLEKEAAIMTGLQHPLFPRYYGMWKRAGMGCLLMEYVTGSSLEELLVRRGSFSIEQTIRIGMELSEGLMYLHEKQEGILFRDVKPANIMIQQDGRVRLLDFGCAYTARGKASSRAGTPGYAAPEQLSGQCCLTTASDVYGLGQTLKAVSGMGRNGLLKQEKVKGKKSKRLWRLLEACTRQEMSKRIPDMREVMAALMSLQKKGGSHFRRENIYVGRNIICLKNIWESAYKNS